MFNRQYCVVFAGWVAIAGLSLAKANDSVRPNIVLILADDFGVGDIHSLNPESPIATPNLDRLVSQGMRFTDAHSPSAVCTPTRYGLLTGRYAWRTELQEWVIAAYEPPLINAERKTLPSMLKQTGYRTSCVGKWHLGWDWRGSEVGRRLGESERTALAKLQWDYSQPMGGGPTDRGFDEYFGVDLPNFPPFTFIENNRVLVEPSDRYVPDDEQGVVMPTQFKGLPMAPGWRFDQILPTLTDKMSERIAKLAAAEGPFFLYFPMTAPHEPVSPSPAFVGKSGIAPIADFLMETDASVGRVLDAIDKAGIAENTIVIFTADNGHSHYTGWDALVAAGHHPSGHYRGHKGDIWEGGHRVPMVVRWPGKIRENSQSDRLVSLVDWMATIAELTGSTLSDSDACDSYSFLDALLGRENSAANAARTSLIVHSVSGEFAFRDGPWKLVFRTYRANLAKTRGMPTLAELYHLGDDPSETRDLAEEQPDRVRAMTTALRNAIDTGATRPSSVGKNDTEVTYFITQPTRWGKPSLSDDQLRERIVGSWQMVGATLNGRPSKVHYSAATIKHITPAQFTWLSYSPEDRQVFRSSGGSWEVQDGKYIETARYGLQENYRETSFGKTTSIQCYFDGDLLTQYMVFAGDVVLVETWRRLKSGEDAAEIPTLD